MWSLTVQPGSCADVETVGVAAAESVSQRVVALRRGGMMESSAETGKLAALAIILINFCHGPSFSSQLVHFGSW